MNGYAMVQNYSDEAPHQESLNGMLGSGRLNINKAINGALFPSIIINEVLADPASDPINGDANGDGIRHSQHDEFVELIPTSIEDAVKLVWNGNISDVKTIIGILWAERLLS